MRGRRVRSLNQGDREMRVGGRAGRLERQIEWHETMVFKLLVVKSLGREVVGALRRGAVRYGLRSLSDRVQLMGAVKDPGGCSGGIPSGGTWILDHTGPPSVRFAKVVVGGWHALRKVLCLNATSQCQTAAGLK